ncbi:MAG TPA: hypothetical protein DCE41_25855 [Cytophagales bacterium]|nr:hypothetical protein [Cytophagales bacterium]
MRFLSTSFLLVTVLVWSCNPEPEVDPGEETQAVSALEAAEVAGTSLAEDDQGFTATLSSSTLLAVTAQGQANGGGRMEVCGVTADTTLVFNSPATAPVTFSYEFAYQTLLNCSNFNVPQSFDVDLTYSGSFDGPRYTSNNTGEGDMSVTNILPNDENFLVAGAWDRVGNSTFSAREERSYTSTSSFTFADVQVSKSTYEVVSGTATLQINGTIDSGESFEYTASVTFLGDGQADITIGDETFRVDLENGEVTQG